MPLIPGYERYDLRPDGVYDTKRSRYLVSGLDMKGYVTVTVRDMLTGRYHRTNLHILVALTYHGLANGLCALHKNGDKANNAPDNIYYGTPQQNSDDRVKHGNAPRGSAVNRSKLTADQVLEIRELAKTIPALQLAKRYNVTHVSIHAIIQRKSWAWL